MHTKKIIQITMVLLVSAGLGLVAYPADQRSNTQYVENDNLLQAPSCGTDVADTESGNIADTESDYITDNIEVPALGADISQAQILENTAASEDASAHTSANQSTDQSADQQGQSSLTAYSQVKAAGEPPSSYDSRNYGYITSAKDQGDDNTCWAYSAAGVAETDMIAGGKLLEGAISTAGNTDFSEDHLTYFFYHMPQDPMGNTDGDATTPNGSYRDVGGNHVFTTFALADWYGLADETKTADMQVYSNVDGEVDDWKNQSPSLSEYPDSVHMQKAYWINLATDASNVKKMIQEYGSVAISMYYSNYYLNSTTGGYYNNIFSGVNHAVQVIGWDDNYSRSNFKTAPSADGAWLAKFSYGTTYGNEGYVWISYEDAALNTLTAKAFVFDFESADNYDNIYQYDGSAGAYIDNATNDTGYRIPSGNSIANVFTVPEDNATGYQKLAAVSFALYATSVDYSIQIYKNPVDASNPTSGTALLASPKTGTTSFVGYYTIPLEEEPILTNGDTFSVVVTLAKSGGEDISYFVDKSYENGKPISWISFTNAVSAGQSFAMQSGGWQDLASSGATARIKAFTDDYQVAAESMKISAGKKTLWKGDTAQLNVQILPTNASYQTANWSSSDTAVVTIDQNGLLTATGAGTAVVTATAKDNSGLSSACAVTVQQPVERVESGSIVCILNQTVPMQLKLYPENTDLGSVYFQSLNPSVATVDASGQITGHGVGVATIQVYSAYNNELLLSCDVNVQAQTTDNTMQMNNSTGGVQMVESDSVQSATKSVKAPRTGDESSEGNWLLLLAVGMLVAVVEGRKLLHR